MPTKPPKPSSPEPDDPNHTVWEYLAAYCRAEASPGYAVMLVGKWGAGKTYFIKKLFEQIEKKNIYITLNGVSSVVDIEAQILRQLHPVLSSKGMKIAGIVAKGLLKGTLKIDLNDDDKDDGSASVGLPDLKLSDIAKSSKGRILVFDDLERCRLSASEALGYINAFVEHEEMKVIVLANEKELKKDTEDFNRIKEKLIGQTVELQPHVHSAYPHLVETLSDAWTKDFLARHKQAALAVFLQSESENLRALRQALQDFERFAIALRPNDKKHDESLAAILQVVLAMSLDFRVGNLEADDLALAHEPRAWSLGRRDDEQPTRFEAFEKRYKDIDLRVPWLSKEVTGGLFVQGWVEAAVIHEALDRSPPFIPSSREPEWRRAWHGFEVGDDDYEMALAEVEANFSARKYVIPGEILHVFGIRLEAARIGAIPLSTAEVESQGRVYLDDLERNGSLIVPPLGQDAPIIHHGFAGLGFMQDGSAEFRALRIALEASTAALQTASQPAEAQKLLSILRSDAVTFARLIRINNVTQALYWDIPVFRNIPTAEFADALLAIDPADFYTVMRAITDRYQTGGAGNKLLEELPWLIALRDALRTKLTDLRPMSRHRIETFISTALNSGINILQELAPPPPPSPSRTKSASKSMAKRPRAPLRRPVSGTRKS